MTIAISEPVAELADATDATSYALGAFTPSANATLLCFVAAENTTAVATMTGGSLTWTLKTSVAFNGGASTLYVFWANTGASPASCTATFDCTGDGATACMMMMFELTGTDLVASDPIRQVKTATGSSTAPAVTFDAAMLAVNGYCAAFGLNANPPTASPPSGWTEIMDSGVGGGSQQPFAASGAYRAGGETGSTVTFASSAGQWGIIAVEVIAAVTEAATSLGVGLGPHETGISASMSLVSSATFAATASDSLASIMAIMAASSIGAGITAAQGTGFSASHSLTLSAGGGAGPASSIVQNGTLIFDQILSVLTSAGIPINVSTTFAAGVQFIIVEPPQNLTGVTALATANGLTLAAQSVPQVATALAAALGLNAASGFAFDSNTTLAAQAGIATVAQQIVNTAVLTGASLVVLAVPQGIFRSVVIGPAGLDALAAAQASPVAQLALIAGEGLTVEAQAGWAAAIAAGIVLTITQQTQAVQESMVALGATPGQALAASVGFQSMLAIGVATTCRVDTSFGSPLTGSVVQIINEVYRVADIQD